MNGSITQCDDRKLTAMLTANENDGKYDSWVDHVEYCQRCQTRLRDLAADDGDWRKASEVLARSENDGVLPATGDHECRTTWNESMVKHLLDPPTHPEMLGRLGRYEIERLIGSGGMGVVFKAFDTELNRPVAVKVLAPYLASSGAARKRFSREARAAAGVVDDHVVPIFNVESEGDPQFLVMQYIAGGSLQEKLDRDGPLDVAEVLRIGLQTAKGLAAAHAQGLIHRDVKPSNILLDEGVERALITDFGLARAEHEVSLTQTGFHPGTPQYMSPEQVRGESIDGRSDLFALGCVMYGLLTGHPPFQGDSSYTVLRRITDDTPKPISECNPHVPAWLEHIVMKLLAKSPEDRFASAAELAQTLEVCLAHVQQPAATPLPESLTSATRNRVRPPWGVKLWGAVMAVFVVSTAFLVLLASGMIQVGSGDNADTPANRRDDEVSSNSGNQLAVAANGAPNANSEQERPSLDQLVQAFTRHESNYLPYHVKAMETLRMNEGLSAQDKRRYPWSDGLKHQRQMEYAQRESGLWLRKEISLKDDAVQSRSGTYASGEQQINVSERPGSDGGLQVHLEQEEYQAKMVSCTPYAGVFPLSVYSDSLLLSEAIASERTIAKLDWDGSDAVLEFQFGWAEKPLRFRLWLSRDHEWHPIRLQRFNTASSKQYFSQWQATQLRKERDKWRIEKGTIGYRHYEDADKQNAKVMYFVDFEVMSAEFGEAVTRDRFAYDIPRHAHVHDAAKPKASKPIEKSRPMTVAVTGVDGDPVPDASVRFQSRGGQLIDSVVTDESGVATSQSVPADVFIEVSAPLHRTARWINGPRSNKSQIVLAPVTKGTAKNASGRAVSDALISSLELRFRADGMAYIPRHESANRENDWSNDSGEFSLTTELTLFPRDKKILIMAVDDAVENMAITSIPASQLEQRLELNLQPICQVEGQFVFNSVASKLAFDADVVDEQGHRIAFVTPTVRVKDNKTVVTFKLRLPAGSYRLRGRGTSSYPDFYASLIIPSQKRQLDFGSIPVDAAGLSALVGKPAPELSVKTRSGEELLLSDLKGSVVVLDFWGHWCVPCVRDMPRLMEIAEQFKDQPIRWITVHDPSLASFNELDEKITKFERGVWDRKIALETVIDVAAQSGDRTGITADRFGIREWPTLVILGQDGTVVGSATKSELIDTLREQIGKAQR